MARPVPSNFSSMGRPPRYPWREWFNGQCWELVQGADFHESTREFLETARRAAYRHGKRIRHEQVGQVFYLQAFRRKDDQYGEGRA